MAALADLFRSAILMIRQSTLRRNPEADEAEIAAVRAWLDRCPGAEHGDGGADRAEMIDAAPFERAG